MKLEVGMYVRTNYGLIFKIKKVVSSRKVVVAYGDVFDDYELKTDEIDIKELIEYYEPKASFNLIDLIEVGDYVNEYKITQIHEPSRTNCNRRIICCLNGSLNNEIKKVLTHEQYEANCYKVGE